MLTCLNSFGCSFTSGAELSDYAPHHCSDLTWPALLAKHYARCYRCHAVGGTGNLAIAERVFQKLNTRDLTKEPFIWIVNWTYSDRWDFSPYVQDVGPSCNWHTVTPGNASNQSKFYYGNLHSQLHDKISNLTIIHSVIRALIAEKIPFLMTNIDDTLMETEWHLTASVKYLQDQVRPYLHSFRNLNFLKWSKDNGFALGVGGHPLEAAHAAAAQLMIPVTDAILHKV